MSFKKKMKIRLFVAIGYLVLGAGIIAASVLVRAQQPFFSSYGLALAVIGIVRIRQYIRIVKDEESLRAQEIRESDERNLYLATKAKSIAYYLFVVMSGVAVIVLQILGLGEYAMILSLGVCALLVLYVVVYWVLRKRS